MRTSLRALIRNDRAAAAAETALMLPILLALLFGPLELGNYFLSEHKVIKAVRDGARYAARQSWLDYPGCMPSVDLVTRTQNVTRTGTVSGTGDARFASSATIDVSGACDTSGAYTGIYVNPNAPGVPVVTVTASVPYTPVLNQLGLTSTTLTLHAESEAAVTGI